MIATMLITFLAFELPPLTTLTPLIGISAIAGGVVTKLLDKLFPSKNNWLQQEAQWRSQLITENNALQDRLQVIEKQRVAETSHISMLTTQVALLTFKLESMQKELDECRSFQEEKIKE